MSGLGIVPSSSPTIVACRPTRVTARLRGPRGTRTRRGARRLLATGRPVARARRARSVCKCGGSCRRRRPRARQSCRRRRPREDRHRERRFQALGRARRDVRTQREHVESPSFIRRYEGRRRSSPKQIAQPPRNPAKLGAQLGRFTLDGKRLEAFDRRVQVADVQLRQMDVVSPREAFARPRSRWTEILRAATRPLHRHHQSKAMMQGASNDNRPISTRMKLAIGEEVM